MPSLTSSNNSHQNDFIQTEQLFSKITRIIDSGREEASQAIYNVLTKSYYLVGKEIFEEEQSGQDRATYGAKTLKSLSEKLTLAYGRGYSVSNLKEMREFYIAYSKGQTASVQFSLSFSHYVLLTGINDPERYFYEQLAIKEKLKLRELKEAIKKNVYQRSFGENKLIGIEDIKNSLSNPIEIRRSNPITKDPIILDFLGIKKDAKYLESELELRIINNLEKFLLEIGRGFAFYARQFPIYISGKYFPVDLVFYHVVLKCYVLIDLKRGLVKHQDIGQMLMYVNYFDKDIKQENDVPTIGVVLGGEKDNKVVEYTLGENQQVFVTKYLTYLPDKKELLNILNQSEEPDQKDDKSSENTEN